MTTCHISTKAELKMLHPCLAQIKTGRFGNGARGSETLFAMYDAEEEQQGAPFAETPARLEPREQSLRVLRAKAANDDPKRVASDLP